MAKTNSNSITALFIETLENKKSGFKSAMIDFMNTKIEEKNKNSQGKINQIIKIDEFKNGTHLKIIKGLKGKMPDIVGVVDNKPVVLIEIKAGENEKLTPAQKGKKEGSAEYAKYSQKNNIPLFYVIPNQYKHKENLPENAIHITWKEVKDQASKYDYTSFSKCVESFVEGEYADQIVTNVNSLNYFCKFVSTLVQRGIIVENYEIWTGNEPDLNNPPVAWIQICRNDGKKNAWLGIALDTTNTYLYLEDDMFKDRNKYKELVKGNFGTDSVVEYDKDCYVYLFKLLDIMKMNKANGEETYIEVKNECLVSLESLVAEINK